MMKKHILFVVLTLAFITTNTSSKAYAYAPVENIMVSAPKSTSSVTSYEEKNISILSVSKSPKKLTYSVTLDSTYGMIAGSTATLKCNCKNSAGDKVAANFNSTITFYLTEGSISYNSTKKSKKGEDATISEYTENYVKKISTSTVCSKKATKQKL